MIYGCARVSTSEQETTLQLDALKRVGVMSVHQEKRSRVASRPVLSALLENLREGGKLYIYKINRFARSLIDLLNIVQKIEAAGASFQSLTEPIDTSTGAGRMMVHLLNLNAVSFESDAWPGRVLQCPVVCTVAVLARLLLTLRPTL